MSSAFNSLAGSTVSAVNGGVGSGVFWNIGSSATIGANLALLGNVIADQTITLGAGSTILCGRAIALNAAVTMDNNTISSDCTNGGDYGTGRSDFGSAGFAGDPSTILPEPSTFVLMLAGILGVVGFARWRAVTSGRTTK